MKKTINIFASFIFLLLSVNFGYAIEDVNLSLHEVKNECVNCQPEEYRLGRELFKDYKFHWLSDDFVIKSKPDISLYPVDIVSIVIEKIEYPTGQSSEQFSDFFVTIVLDVSASKKLKDYTKDNADRKVALYVENTLLTIVSIKFVLENSFSFALRDSDYSKIENIFKRLSDNLSLE